MQAQTLIFSGSEKNDLYQLLRKQGVRAERYETWQEAIQKASKGDGLIIASDGYPEERTKVTDTFYRMAQEKRLRLYIEYPDYIPGISLPDSFFVGNLERGVITSDFFGKQLPEMSLLGLNDCHIYPVKVKEPLIAYARVAGFDHAQYGLTGTDVYPLLFKKGQAIITTTCLTNFKTARYAPNVSWRIVWEKLLAWLTQDKKITLDQWGSDPQPSYTGTAVLSSGAREKSIEKGAEWFFKGRFLIHPSWKAMAKQYEGDGTNPFGPPVGSDKLSGDGSLGILEGHASRISYDGKEQYRYWIRNDVQGEAAFLLASAGNLLGNEKYKSASEKLIDFIFYESNFRQGARNDKDSAVYGLLGWATTHPYVFYSDDNARSILGVIGSSALSGNDRWNRFIVENILANLRTCSKQGFQGGRLEQNQIQEKGWQYFNERDYINPHPHFESWMWACYLWLYDKTGYRPLLDKAKTAIQITMEAYPDKWNWTNGIQQERARMILPLAWLVRVEDTPLHRQWLDTVVKKLLENQQPCGAIREELGGSGSGMFAGTKSNKEYGLHEAPLIAENGDPVADMLYTSNFAFFALNEAARATGNQEYKDAVEKLSGFLIRIQAKSDKHEDIDGAWMRAFDYNRWDYWASNADAGWGAWSTLTGWIQSWIVSTLVLLEKEQSYWEITRDIHVKKEMKEALWMLEK